MQNVASQVEPIPGYGRGCGDAKGALTASLQDLEAQPLLFHGFGQPTTISANAIPWLTNDPTDLVTPRTLRPKRRRTGCRQALCKQACRTAGAGKGIPRPKALGSTTCITEAAVALHRNRMQTIALLMCCVHVVRARLHLNCLIAGFRKQVLLIAGGVRRERQDDRRHGPLT